MHTKPSSQVTSLQSPNLATERHRTTGGRTLPLSRILHTMFPPQVTSLHVIGRDNGLQRVAIYWRQRGCMGGHSDGTTVSMHWRCGGHLLVSHVCTLQRSVTFLLRKKKLAVHRPKQRLGLHSALRNLRQLKLLSAHGSIAHALTSLGQFWS